MGVLGLRAGVTKVAAAMAVGLLAWTVVGAADAAPFAGERFAPVPNMSDSAALDVDAITVTPGESGAVTFGLTFSAPFASPTDGYRVSVSVGDPTAKRTRWSVRVIDGQVVGVVETGDGAQWTQGGSAAAQLDPAGGTASIVAQPGTVTAGSALWVDAELPTPLGTLGALSSYFSYDALVSVQNDPSIAGTTWGWVRDAAGAHLDTAVHLSGAPPTAAIINSALVISSPDAPPTLLLGQPVTSANDYVKFADANAAVAGDGGFVMVNRVTGDVQLFSVKAGVPTVIAGAGQRVVPAGAANSEPPGTRTVSLDLAAVERELGLSDDPSNSAISVDRGLGLADGSIVSASGVAATVASLEAVGTTPEGDGATGDVVESVEKSSSDNVPVALIAAAAVLALVVIGIVAFVLLVKQRRSRHESLLAEGWFDRELAARPLAPRPPVAPMEVTPPPPPVEVAEEPVLDLNEVERTSEPVTSNGQGHGNSSPTADDADSNEPTTEETATDDIVIEETTSEDTASKDAASKEPASEDPASEDTARATQDRALEVLEAQFADLAHRVDQLGSGPDRS